MIEKFKSQGNLEDLKIELNSVRYDVFRLEILELESHMNMGVVFQYLPNLTDLAITYGAKHKGMEYESSLFGMKMADAEVFSECLRTTQSLVKLSMPNNLLDYDLIKILSRGLMLNKTISILDFSHNKIGNSASSKIALYLYQSKILTHLYLGDNVIHEKGARCIGDALKVNRSLRVLDMHLNRIDDKGGMRFIQALSERGGNKVLQELNLRANSLESNFADALSKLLMDTGLKRIDVSCNMIKKRDGDSLLASLSKN